MLSSVSILPIIRDMLYGVSFTMLYTIFSLFFGLIFGILLGILQNFTQNTIIQKLIAFYISVIRGTPLIIQLFLFYFTLRFKCLGIWNMHLVIIVTFAINSSAYVVAAISSGIKSIGKEQLQTARSLHISIYMTWKDIILPQLLVNMLPVITNEAISLLKETAVISIIGGMDITGMTKVITSRLYKHYLFFNILAGIIYYILSHLLVMLFRYLTSLIQRTNNTFEIPKYLQKHQ